MSKNQIKSNHITYFNSKQTGKGPVMSYLYFLGRGQIKDNKSVDILVVFCLFWGD